MSRLFFDLSALISLKMHRKPKKNRVPIFKSKLFSKNSEKFNEILVIPSADRGRRVERALIWRYCNLHFQILNMR